MQTSRLLLVVVGDVEPREIRKSSGVGVREVAARRLQAAPLAATQISSPTVEVTQRGIPTNYIQGVFAAPPLTSADIYPMRIASAILQNRVFVEVRVRRNLSYAPDAFLRYQDANTGGIYVTAVDANQAVRVMLSEISRLQHEPISADEFKAYGAAILTRYYLGTGDERGAGGRACTVRAYRRRLAQLFGLPRPTPRRHPADVQRVASTTCETFSSSSLATRAR